VGETLLEQATQHRAWDSLPNPFITEIETSAIRSELVERVLRSLSADGERGEGELLRRDVDRTYLRRNLTIAECGHVEKKLIAAGFRILDEESSDPDLAAAPAEQRNRKFLTETEERELGRKIQLAKQMSADSIGGLSDFDRRVLRDAEKAKTRFVETNLLYVRKLAARRRNLKHLTYDDVFQEGLMGLLRATELYDPELGFRFKTYATWWIQQHIHRALDDADRTIRLPVHLQESVRKIRRKSAKLSFELGREPSLAELATSIGVDREKLAKLLWRLHATDCVEADAPISEDATVISFKVDEALDAFEIVSQQQLRSVLARVLNRLSPREERIIRLRFGLDGEDDHTLEAIGNKFDVTRERIRQIEAKALRKLKHPSSSRVLRTFLND
jgi:RNA polymerase primary sigma factor